MQETNTGTRTNTAKGRFEKDFEALPLEEKFKQLFKLEAATLSEAVTYVVNSSSRVFEDIGNAMSDIGKKVEHEVRNAGPVCDTEPPTPPPSAAGFKGTASRKRSATKKPRPASKP